MAHTRQPRPNSGPGGWTDRAARAAEALRRPLPELPVVNWIALFGFGLFEFVVSGLWVVGWGLGCGGRPLPELPVRLCVVLSLGLGVL